MEQPLTKQDILESWKQDSFMSTVISVMKCENCGITDICQHQGRCIQCMANYANMSNEIHEKHKGKCQMCDKKISQPREIQICRKCLKNSF